MTEFEKLYRDYFDDVYLYIRRLSGDEHTAEEITSETFFRAMRSISSFRGDCDIRVWLCQIAKNCYYNYLKKSQKTDHLDDAELSQLPSEECTIEEQYINREEATRIRAILHTVPEPYKEVFMWRVFAELSFKQIGQIFGKSENWACVTYHRAKMKIQSRLEDKSYEK
ncbi:MAG: sigma-70 family RNA polymerase sigma factor [Firmicutes bacterium]|nr:sigma-70 family RNA polymerase sigma factor [Bacillota bacterium]